MAELNKDIDAIARTIMGEALNEPYEGKVAVGWTIMNRLQQDPRQYGSTAYDVAHKGKKGIYQYSAWNPKDAGGNALVNLPETSKAYKEAYKIAEDVYHGRVEDPTAGATMYYAPASISGPKAIKSHLKQLGDWQEEGIGATLDIGRHRFNAPIPIPRTDPRRAPMDVASLETPRGYPDMRLPMTEEEAQNRRQAYAQEQARITQDVKGATEKVFTPTPPTIQEVEEFNRLMESQGLPSRLPPSEIMPEKGPVRPPPRLESTSTGLPMASPMSPEKLLAEWDSRELPPVPPMPPAELQAEWGGRELPVPPQIAEAYGQSQRLRGPQRPRPPVIPTEVPSPEEPGMMDRFSSWLAEGDTPKAMMHYGLALAARPTHGMAGALRDMAAAGLSTEEYMGKLAEAERRTAETKSLAEARVMSDMEREANYIKRLATSDDPNDRQLAVMAASRFIGKAGSGGAKISQAEVNAVLGMFKAGSPEWEALQDKLRAGLGMDVKQSAYAEPNAGTPKTLEDLESAFGPAE
jgi:hypothetical protein